MQDGTTDLSTLSFSTTAAQRTSTPFSNVAKLADATKLNNPGEPLSNVARCIETTELEDPKIPQDLQCESGIVAGDDDADESESSNEEADAKEENEESCEDAQET